MGATIGIVAGLALLGAIMGKNGSDGRSFHEKRMDRVHNRTEMRSHRANARHGISAPYSQIRYERPQPVRTMHTVYP